MSGQERQPAVSGWQFDFQPWPVDPGHPDPGPALPSSCLDVTQNASDHDLQWQSFFDDFNHQNVEVNNLDPQDPLLDEVFNAADPGIFFPDLPSDPVEQRQDDVVAAEVTGPKKPRRSRIQAPSAAEWNAQKDRISDLYMVQDKTLRETMDIMKDTHNFSASLQMFKDKCQEWNFVKNLPRKLTGKLLRIADERKPKGTVFQLGPRKWTTAEIKRKSERGLKNNDPKIHESPELPSSLVCRTPTVSPVIREPLLRHNSISIPGSPAMHFYAASPLPVRMPEVSGPMTYERLVSPLRFGSSEAAVSPWAPDFSRRQQGLFQGRMLPPPLPSHTSVSVPWQNVQNTMPTTSNLFDLLQPLTARNSVEELKSKRSSALVLARDGKLDHAIERLRVVIRGFERSLSSTHPLTVQTSYELAKLLGDHDDMIEATSLLDWLGSELVSKHGLQSERTILHYLRVVQLLRSWSRDQDARLLVHKIAEIWDTDHPSSAPTIPGSLSETTGPAVLSITELHRLFREPVDESDADVQIQLVEMLLSFTSDVSSNIEDELRRITSYCESNQMFTQTIHTRHCLSRFYANNEMRDKAVEVLDSAIPTLEQALHFDEYDSPCAQFLEHCREFAFAYHNVDASDQCEDVLEATADGLETYAQRYGAVPQKATIDFLFKTGKMWLEKKSWKSAEPWFERALLNAIKHLGKSHTVTALLERTLIDKCPPLTERGIFDRAGIDPSLPGWGN